MPENFQKLIIWQKARDLTVRVYKVSQSFPKEEQFGLTNQLRRSANSVPANIAEGSGRFTPKDRIQFLIIARGSLTETQSHLLVACQLGFITDNIVHEIYDEYEALARQLNAYINTVRKSLKSD
jgi:four helix bundle protein